MENKKGLSGVVETVVLVLMVLGAIVIVGVFVNSLINKNIDEASSLLNQIELRINKVNVTDLGAKVQVERIAGEGNITGVRFVLNDGENSLSVNNYTALDNLEMRTYNLNVSDFDWCNLKKISVVPLTNTASGKEVIGKLVAESEEIIFSRSC